MEAGGKRQGRRAEAPQQIRQLWGNLTLSRWIKAVCLVSGPSVHTSWVIRPNYERKVCFPFMLLNQSRPQSPRISQHQQGAGDLQIKRSHYLCPSSAATPPVPPLGIAAHTRASEGARLWYEASKFLLLPLWDWRGVKEEGIVLPTFLTWLHSTGIMWSSNPPELPSGPRLPFINKIGESKGVEEGEEFIRGASSCCSFTKDDYAGLGILRAPVQISYAISSTKEASLLLPTSQFKKFDVYFTQIVFKHVWLLFCTISTI